MSFGLKFLRTGRTTTQWSSVCGNKNFKQKRMRKRRNQINFLPLLLNIRLIPILVGKTVESLERLDPDYRSRRRHNVEIHEFDLGTLQPRKAQNSKNEAN
jgi:hypothetical protein